MMDKHLPSASPTSLPKISAKELELVKRIALGYSSKQVASFLGITRNTVDTHRRNLLRKTGCKNTMELVVRCVKAGLF